MKVDFKTIKTSKELPVDPRIQFVQMYASAIAQIPQIGKTAVNQFHISCFLGFIKILFFKLSIIFLLSIFFLWFVLIHFSYILF